MTKATTSLSERENDLFEPWLVTTLAGGQRGYSDGSGIGDNFEKLNGIAMSPDGNIIVSDHRRVRVVTPLGVVTTLAGGCQGSSDGTGQAACFSNVNGITVDSLGRVLVTDGGGGDGIVNHAIRAVTPAGLVTTLAGSTVGTCTDDGSFFYPQSIVVSASGILYVKDYCSGVRVMDTNTGNFSTFGLELGGLGLYGINSDGKIFATMNGRFNWIDPASGAISVIEGGGGFSPGINVADGVGINAILGITVDGKVDLQGNVFFTNTQPDVVRMISPTGAVTTIAGCSTSYGGGQFCPGGFVDGLGTNSLFVGPLFLTVSGDGVVYVADRGTYAVRKVALVPPGPPSEVPSPSPSTVPSLRPSAVPSVSPSAAPSASPSRRPRHVRRVSRSPNSGPHRKTRRDGRQPLLIG